VRTILGELLDLNKRKKMEIDFMPWYNNEIMIDVIFHDITNITVNVLNDHDIYMSIYEY
jgi:hypothetical protein